MGVKEQIKEGRERFVREVGMYALQHPQMTRIEVGHFFGVSEQWVRRACRFVGEANRKPGRKAGKKIGQ